MEPITQIIISKLLLTKLSTAGTAAKCTIIKSGTAKCTLVKSSGAAKSAAAKAKTRDTVAKACCDAKVFTQAAVP